MGLFDKIFGKKDLPEDRGLPEVTQVPESPKVKKPRKPRQPKEKIKTAKEIANEKNEPWVNIVSVELDPNNIGSGAFELDWNDKFVATLVRAGYQLRPDEPENEIVDRWFATICRNVALETYQQEMADPEIRARVERRNLGNGRTEIS